MAKVPELFGSMVFNEQTTQERLPKATYKALQKTIQNGEPLDLSVANVVANAMKDWAVEKGCTHYTHWFQPMTGVTAEKHDSFISPNGDGQVIMDHSQAEAYAQHLKQEVTQHGTLLLMRLLKTVRFIFRRHSAHIRAKFLIKKPLYCVQWKE